MFWLEDKKRYIVAFKGATVATDHLDANICLPFVSIPEYRLYAGVERNERHMFGIKCMANCIIINNVLSGKLDGFFFFDLLFFYPMKASCQTVANIE